MPDSEEPLFLYLHIFFSTTHHSMGIYYNGNSLKDEKRLGNGKRNKGKSNTMIERMKEKMTD